MVRGAKYIKEDECPRRRKFFSFINLNERLWFWSCQRPKTQHFILFIANLCLLNLSCLSIKIKNKKIIIIIKTLSTLQLSSLGKLQSERKGPPSHPCAFVLSSSRKTSISNNLLFLFFFFFFFFSFLYLSNLNLKDKDLQ